MFIEGTVNWGIIGCGDVCEVKSGPAFNKIANSKLHAVMRRDEAKAKDYAERHRVPYYYGSAEKLLSNTDVNAIYIATPPSTHELYTRLALESGRPVYLEKPVSLDAASCQRMIELKDKYGGRVSVAHYRRELTLFKKLKDLIGNGAIGTVRLIKVETHHAPPASVLVQCEDNWRINPEISGGGIFHDLSPHQLDILYWLFGKPEWIKGFSANQSHLYSAPDIVMLQALLPGQILVSGTWAFNVPREAVNERCQIIGEKGMLSFSFFKLGNLECTSEEGTRVLEMTYPPNIQQPMIQAVTKYFRGQGENPCSLEEALEVMRMIDSANVQ